MQQIKTKWKDQDMWRILSTSSSSQSNFFKMGPVQCRWPCRVAETWFNISLKTLNWDFGSISWFFARVGLQDTEFTFFSGVQSPKDSLNAIHRDWPRSGELWSLVGHMQKESSRWDTINSSFVRHDLTFWDLEVSRSNKSLGFGISFHVFKTVQFGTNSIMIHFGSE